MPRLTKPPSYIGKKVVNSLGVYMQEGDRLIINVMQNFTKPPRYLKVSETPHQIYKCQKVL
jgi:hypothetical protein